ncbi:hypothetical protein AAG906_015827 [Vitis piasezkii]
MNIADSHKKNQIQVSNTKKSLFFYVNLAKRHMQQHNERSTYPKNQDRDIAGKTENFDELMAAAAEEKWRKMATTVAMVVIGGGLWQAPPN